MACQVLEKTAPNRGQASATTKKNRSPSNCGVQGAGPPNPEDRRARNLQGKDSRASNPPSEVDGSTPAPPDDIGKQGSRADNRQKTGD